MTAPILAQLASALDGARLSLHVLSAAVWVGGQLVLAGLVPTARTLGDDAPRRLARAFSRLSWPAYGLLVATGVWNIAAVGTGQGTTWQVVLGVKLAVVAVSGLSAWLHTRARTRRGLAVWGGVTGASAVTALVLGVFLAG